MAKTESTAVNELIDLVQNHQARPLPAEPSDDLFAAPPRMTRTVPPVRGAGEVAPLPRSRAPQATREQAMPTLLAEEPRVRMTTGKPARGTTIPPLPPARLAPLGTLPPATAPIAAPFEPRPAAERFARASLPVLPGKPELLFESTTPVAHDKIDTTWVGRLGGGRTRADNLALAKKLVLPSLACIAAGIALGFYVSGTKAKPNTPQPAVTQPAAPAPATETVRHPSPRSLESSNAATSTAGGDEPQPPTKAEQAEQMAAVAAEDAAAAGTLTREAPDGVVAGVREVQTIRGVVAMTDVRIDTDPQGASITLVDGGKQFPLGSSPLVTSLDASREYEVIVEMAGRPAQMVHLAPATTSRLDISLGRAQREAAPAPRVERVATVEKVTKAEKTEPVAKVAKAVTTPKAEKAARVDPAKALEDAAPEAAPVVADGPGVLMVSSKPPCEILIDGKATGLTTPQPSIELAAGRHKVTFVNKDAGIKETFTVTVKPGEPTKLIRNFLDR